jgi:hypothetical protein
MLPAGVGVAVLTLAVLGVVSARRALRLEHAIAGVVFPAINYTPQTPRTPFPARNNTYFIENL